MEFKKCIHCGIEKEATEEFFRRTQKTVSGLLGSCRVCENAYKREHYKKNKDKYRQSTMKWREHNKEKYNSYIRDYQKTKGKDRVKAYREENKEKIRTYKQEYYQKNKEKILKQQKEYYRRTRQLKKK